jgi:hypothetical protein
VLVDSGVLRTIEGIIDGMIDGIIDGIIDRDPDIKALGAETAVTRDSTEAAHDGIAPASRKRRHDVLAEAARTAHFAGLNHDRFIDYHLSGSLPEKAGQ